jgi:ATP-dependent Clp protease ATP-binding subunit ClpX
MFICGGAFVGLEKVVARRVGKKTMGFLAEEQNDRNATASKAIPMHGHKDQEMLQFLQPHDLMKFGFIPEFIGRLPVIATLEDLDKQALIQILTRPKNAIIKQYQKLFEYENVRLKFSEDALDAIATLAMERKVGARGLRMILEELMLDLMYYIPSYKKVREFQVTREMVLSQKISLTLLEKAG